MLLSYSDDDRSNGQHSDHDMPSLSSRNFMILHRDLAKALELGVNEKWLMESNLTPKMASDLVKGLLYLREMYPEEWKEET